MPGKLITGVDVYHSIYDSDRSLHLGDPPIHRYDLRQTTAAALCSGDDRCAAGHRHRLRRRACSATPSSARDRLGSERTGRLLFAGPQGLPFDDSEMQYAWHVGIEHRVTPQVAFFGRAARSFRVPNVDERVGDGRRSACRPTSISRPRPRTTSKPASAPARGRSTLADQRLLHGAEERAVLQPGDLHQHQSRSRRSATASRTSLTWRVIERAAVQGRARLYPRAIPRRTVRRQRRAAGVAVDRQRRRCPGTSIRSIWCSTRSRASSARGGWTTTRRISSRRSPARPSSTCARRRDRQVLLVVLGAERVQRALLRIRDRERLHVRHLQRLSAARPHLPGAGRDAVLKF